MAFHLSAWSASIAQASVLEIAPVNDQIIAIQNTRFLLPKDMQLVMAMAMSVNLQRCQLTSPKLRQTNPFYIRPIAGSVVPGSNPNMQFLWDDPEDLSGQEELVVNAIQGGAAAERVTVLGWFSDGIVPRPPGDVFTIRATSTTAVVANVWSDIAIALETTLPKGTYAVIGAECQSTTIQAFRLIFDNQYYRPGYPGMTSLQNRLPYDLYLAPLGVWGYFRTFSIPRVQILANAADAAFEIYLDILRVGP